MGPVSVMDKKNNHDNSVGIRHKLDESGAGNFSDVKAASMWYK